MKILAFADTHGNLTAFKKIKKKAEKVDVIICGGDLTMFSDKLFYFMQQLDSLGKPVMIIHGNHETHADIKGLAKMLNNIRVIHNSVYKIDKKYIFFGWGGGGFATKDDKFEKSAIKKFKKYCNKDFKTILVTHAPPYGTKLDIVYYEHVGNKSIFRFIYKNQPDYAISGHIHECSKRRDMIKKTPIINAGSDGVIVEL